MRRPPTGYRELRIFGEDPPRDRLDLIALIREVEHARPGLLSVRWILVYGADGYGEDVVNVSTRLEGGRTVEVTGNEFLAWVGDGRQSFAEVHVRVPDVGVEFGLFDSTFLFVRGPEDLLRSIASIHPSVQIVDR